MFESNDILQVTEKYLADLNYTIVLVAMFKGIPQHPLPFSLSTAELPNSLLAAV